VYSVVPSTIRDDARDMRARSGGVRAENRGDGEEPVLLSVVWPVVRSESTTPEANLTRFMSSGATRLDDSGAIASSSEREDPSLIAAAIQRAQRGERSESLSALA
jgi:hypothetical protein